MPSNAVVYVIYRHVVMSGIVSAVRFCLCRGLQSFAAVSIVSACFASGQLMRLMKSHNTLKISKSSTQSHRRVDHVIMPCWFVACHRLLQLNVETTGRNCRCGRWPMAEHCYGASIAFCKLHWYLTARETIQNCFWQFPTPSVPTNHFC